MAAALRTVQKSAPAFIRSFHVSSAFKIKEPLYTMTQTEFKSSGFYKYGLLRDDLLNMLHPEVEEAIRRLPEELQMQRLHRSIRAQQAELCHAILPEDQWTKYEDDHFYLRPYLEEVLKEKEEREEWDANH